MQQIVELEAEKIRLEGRCEQAEAEKSRLEGRCKQMEAKNRDLSNFYQKKKERHPTKWQWLFGDDQPPDSPIS